MHAVGIVTALALTLGSGGPAGQDPPPAGPAKPDPAAREVKDAVEVWTAAMHKGDRKAFAALVTPDLTWVNQDGRLDDLKKVDESLGSNNYFYPFVNKADEVGVLFNSVRVTGGTAVAVGTWVATTANGETLRGRFTVVLVKADGGWKVTAVHHAGFR